MNRYRLYNDYRDYRQLFKWKMFMVFLSFYVQLKYSDDADSAKINSLKFKVNLLSKAVMLVLPSLMLDLNWTGLLCCYCDVEVGTPLHWLRRGEERHRRHRPPSPSSQPTEEILLVLVSLNQSAPASTKQLDWKYLEQLE